MTVLLVNLVTLLSGAGAQLAGYGRGGGGGGGGAGARGGGGPWYTNSNKQERQLKSGTVGQQLLIS